MSSKSFAELGVSAPLIKALTSEGAVAPFAIQSLVLPDALAGRDVLAQSPTGSGKTLAFAIPLAQRLTAGGGRPGALVLAPTRELAQQILASTQPLLRARGLAGCCIYGGAGIARQAKLARTSHLIVATPGRLLDLIQRGDVKLGGVEMLVLDEADRMLDMGFKPTVDRIVSEIPRERQTLFFSATLAGQTGALAKAYTRSARRHEHAEASTATPAIEHRFLELNEQAKLPVLVRTLRAEDQSQTLVFVRTKRGADRLVKRLRAHDLESVAMHGNKSQGQRERALAQFRDGHVNTLIATDVAARGIDVDDIDHVINFDAPTERDAYVHRVGRTGRAGQTGISTTFVLHGQTHEIRKLARSLDLTHTVKSVTA